MSRLLLLLGCAALPAGCAVFTFRQTAALPGSTPHRTDPGLFLLAPAAAGFEASLTQEVSFDRGTAHLESIALLEVSTSEVVLAALSPFGTRMLSLRWDGKKLSQERDPSLPQQFPLELILRDIELVYWPAAAIQAALPGPRWTLRDEGLERSLLEDGQPVVRIRFSDADRLHSDAEFEHLSLGYRLRIHSLPESGEGD